MLDSGFLLALNRTDKATGKISATGRGQRRLHINKKFLVFSCSNEQNFDIDNQLVSNIRQLNCNISTELLNNKKEKKTEYGNPNIHSSNDEIKGKVTEPSITNPETILQVKDKNKIVIPVPTDADLKKKLNLPQNPLIAFTVLLWIKMKLLIFRMDIDFATDKLGMSMVKHFLIREHVDKGHSLIESYQRLSEAVVIVKKQIEKGNFEIKYGVLNYLSLAKDENDEFLYKYGCFRHAVDVMLPKQERYRAAWLKDRENDVLVQDCQVKLNQLIRDFNVEFSIDRIDNKIITERRQNDLKRLSSFLLKKGVNEEVARKLKQEFIDATNIILI